MTEDQRDKIMSQWDYWRKRIADGDTSSGPRDWFESIIEETIEMANSNNEQVELFICKIIDKYEGCIITEEFLQDQYAKLLSEQKRSLMRDTK